MPHTAYIVEAVRTAGGRKNGRLSGYHPADLGALTVDGLLEKVGAQSGNIGRNIVLSSKKLPESVPGTTVDRMCGSSQQALHFAAQAVMSGTQDVVIAAGVENMSLVAINAGITAGQAAGHGLPLGEEAKKTYGESMKQLLEFGFDLSNFNQFGGAELLARKHNCSKEELDRFAVLSHQRGAEATKAGKFKKEILPVPVKLSKGESPKEMHVVDEGIRPTNYDKVSSMKPMFPNGRLTPATSSQICDGCAAVLVCNEEGLKKLGLKPKAKITAMAVVGSDPTIMLEGPVPATEAVLKKANLKPEDISVVEVNEAFASVPLAVAKTFFGGSLEKFNVNGGAMALGHPLGATGVKLMTTLVHELERQQGRYGLLTICEGGGTANATIIERISEGQSKL